jgi:hypothetical protein
MAYRVSVSRKDGSRVELTQVHHGRTPWRNGYIVVEIDGKPVPVIVTGVKAASARASKTGIEAFDRVEAEEL